MPADEIESDAGEALSGAPDRVRDTYTAVFHVHGMGSQRRYEEISRVVDALDQIAHADPSTCGRLGSIRARVEESRSNLKGTVGYITLVRRISDVAGEHAGSARAYRFYEGYWANVTAEGVPYKEVIAWLLRCVLVPISALRTPWRLRARLRRACLLKIWLGIVAGIKNASRSDLKHLLDYYDQFEGPEARREYPKGTVREFILYLGERIQREERRQRFETLTRRWWRAYVLSELRNLFLLVSAVLALALGAGAILYLLSAALHSAAEITPWVSPLLVNAGILSSASESLVGGFFDLTTGNLLALLATLLSAAGVTGFLQEYLGDVQFWTTYEETSVKFRKRREILDTVGETLIHILADPRCERVVVVSHSLGTTIAFDTLLELARRNRAANPASPIDGPIALGKIRHLITFGSPIDKVHYFFESYSGKYHRYNRVVEELRGDIGTLPFSRKGWPLVHWINFWDQADIVSAPLFSPANRGFPDIHVNNVEVSNGTFPDPAGAHTGYFENPEVVKTIFQATFDNDFAYPAFAQHERLDIAALQLPDGQGRPPTVWMQAVAVSAPWMICGFLLARFLHAPIVSAGLVTAAAAVVFVTSLVRVFKGLRGRSSIEAKLRTTS